MAFIDKILHPPSYGWENEQGELVQPTNKQLFKEAAKKMNVFLNKKNWLIATSVLMILSMLPFLYLFLFKYLSFSYLLVFLLYSMIIMSTHGTIWYHRFATHRAYQFKHPFWRWITQNLVVRTLPEEVYVVSHHVHHAKSDLPGDPYNARAGFWYCMLGELNHQSIARDLNEEDYSKLKIFLSHTGVQLNTYAAYQKLGTLVTPLYAYLSWFFNWAFWYGMFYLIGGHALACTLFSAALFWFVLVRAFNYTGHGKGEVQHKDDIDFDRTNLSINQSRPGWFSGEWHNNHHLYPNSARAGFLPYQIDLAWIYIFSMFKLGAISSYKDNKEQFLKNYYNKKTYKH